MSNYTRKTESKAYEIIPKWGINNGAADDAGYSGLANAIIMQALVDYSISISRLVTKDFQCSTAVYSKGGCEKFAKECYKFLLKDAEAYTELDTRFLLEAVDKKIIAKIGVTKNDIRKLCV